MSDSSRLAKVSHVSTGGASGGDGSAGGCNGSSATSAYSAGIVVNRIDSASANQHAPRAGSANSSFSWLSAVRLKLCMCVSEI